MSNESTTEKAITEIVTMQEHLQRITDYIREHRAAFDSLHFLSTSSIHAGDIKLYCHVIPGQGAEFVKNFGKAEWHRQNGSQVGCYNWRGRPSGAPCDFVVFNAEKRDEFNPFVSL